MRHKFAILAAAIMLTAVPFAVPGVVFANDIQDCLAQGTNLDITAGEDCTNTDTQAGADQVDDIITTIVNIFSAIVGIISVIMIIFGGFKYITSGGDSGNITSAKNTIVYAVIGLVIVALAQFIVQFVLTRVNNSAV